jgi:hypothetical protein
MYGKTGEVMIKLRNRGPAVFIRSIEAVFPCDDGLKPYVARQAVGETLGPNAADSYLISVKPGLRIRPGTQTFRIIVRAEVGGVKHAVTIDPVAHFDFRRRPGKTLVFISHKIPEDTTLAEDLKRYLERAGFEAYLAEHDKRPGLSLWKKIKPNIEAATLVTVLWTRRAVESGYMKKEIRHARALGKHEYLALAPKIARPAHTPAGKEWDRFEAPLDRSAMAAIAERIMNNDKTGLYPNDAAPTPLTRAPQRARHS